jgi:Ca2+-binding RTX toxin-like protein
MEETSIVRSRARWRGLALVGAFGVLLAQFIVWAGPAPAQVTGNVLYGADGAGCNENATLYTINPATGAKTGTIGPIGFQVTGLAVDPTTGQMYGSTGGCQQPIGALLKIDKQTGSGTLITPHIVDGCVFGGEGMADITFTTDGQLWGWTSCTPEALVKINKVTGEGEVIGTGIAGVTEQGFGLAADPDDNVLWLTPDRDGPPNGEYFTVDKATGAGTSQGTLDGDNDGPINSLAWSCDGEALFGTANQAVFSGGGDREFILIDTATDEVTVVGDDVVDRQQDALAFDCAAAAPPPAPAPVQCKGLAATVVGTSGSDTLTGTAARDVVAALAGSDSISALGGKDLVCAGKGKDKANGGGGKDKLLGQGGKDKLKGAGGSDNLRGGKGRDTCNGGPGADTGNCEIERSIP